MVGWRSAEGFVAGAINKSALSWLFIHTCTVWRKLPTMMPTDVVMAIAVASAPTSTDVRRSDDARLREASIASTPPSRRNMPERNRRQPADQCRDGERTGSDEQQGRSVAEERFAGDGGRERRCSPDDRQGEANPEIANLVDACGIFALPARHGFHRRDQRRFMRRRSGRSQRDPHTNRQAEKNGQRRQLNWCGSAADVKVIDSGSQ